MPLLSPSAAHRSTIAPLQRSIRNRARWNTRLGLAHVLITLSLVLPSAAQTTNPVPQEWGVVLGADKTEAAARQEVSQNSRILGQRPRIYRCNGWYRTIAAYASKRDALRGLQRVLDAGSKRSPYIIAIRPWCPSKKLVAMN